jgi:hypothetical protein
LPYYFISGIVNLLVGKFVKAVLTGFAARKMRST